MNVVHRYTKGHLAENLIEIYRILSNTNKVSKQQFFPAAIAQEGGS